MSDHEHTQDPDTSQMWTPEFWDERYASADAVWSRDPNPRLVEQVSGLAPGTALDVGCGEGADAIWLAGRGWQVTAIDVSSVALARAAQHAEQAGPQVASRIAWRQVDLMFGAELPGGFDLVSVQFMHVPRPVFGGLYRRIAAAVRPGGSLLVVGHHPADAQTGVRTPALTDLLFTPDQVTSVLDPGEWDLPVADVLTRQAADREGQTVTVSDTVVHAVRRAGQQ